MFTYSIQFAGSDFDEIESKGQTCFDDISKEIASFPWTEQMNAYNRKQNGASATISVTNTTTQTVLWVSIAGNEKKNNFLIGYVFTKPIKKLFGLGKPEQKKWIDIYNVHDMTTVISLFHLFFLDNEPALLSSLQAEDRFDSMPAR